MALAGLSRRVRRSLGLTQEEFASKLDAAGSSIRNWEAGRKRPSPDFLKKMAELAPAFASEIDGELKVYEWHDSKQGGRRYSEETISALHVPRDLTHHIYFVRLFR